MKTLIDKITMVLISGTILLDPVCWLEIYVYICLRLVEKVKTNDYFRLLFFSSLLDNYY